MKRLIPACVIILGWASSAWAVTPSTLTSLRAIAALGNAEAGQRLPVTFEATVTYYRAYDNLLFVQDGDTAIFVDAPTNAGVIPGDRVLVQGKTHESFRPYIFDTTVTRLRHGDLPKPQPASFDQLIRAQFDCRLVSVHGVVRSVDLHWNSNHRNTYLEILTEGGYVEANIGGYDEALRKDLLDAEVEVIGAASGQFGGKMQQIGVLLRVFSLADVKILKRADVSPWSLPVTSLNGIIRTYHVHDSTQRVHVRGTVTYYQPGSAIVLQNGSESLWIKTQASDPLPIGEVVDATGFPDVHDYFLTMIRATILDTHMQAPIKPLTKSWKQFATQTSSASQDHVFDLVSVEGEVVMEVHEAEQDQYVLVSDGQLLSAIYRRSKIGGLSPVPMKQIPLGSRISVVGICILENSNPFDQEVPFDILLRTPDDIEVVQRPSLLNTRNLLLLVGLLLVAMAFAGAWGWKLERKVRQKTAALAGSIEAEAALERHSVQLEQQRSRILEDINGASPLAEIIEEIAKMASSMLDGAPCWCEVADGAKLGNCPCEQHGLRIVSAKINARSGPPLGEFFVGLDAETAPTDHETLALANGVRLTALAIETRRINSDMRRRSEFDLLTEIHNRFSLDKRLDEVIEEAHRNASIFGLIYIDLDKFKLINDRYGHHVGDLYLQEVAGRMKRQLRGDDILARLGGDEFAALVTVARSRAGVEEIALRLERCFDAPFIMEGYVLRGAASFGIALYPEDGTSKDKLLSVADAIMYTVKNQKKEIEASMAQVSQQEHTALTI
jgi:diguanylate cyclase (GGDEF)-like protein